VLDDAVTPLTPGVETWTHKIAQLVLEPGAGAGIADGLLPIGTDPTRGWKCAVH
jgi:hypothetical protein